METTRCLIISHPSCSIDNETAWKSHAALFLFFLQHQRRGGMETICRLVSPPSCSIKDEMAWSPHAALFPLLPAVLKTRRCGAHMPPRFSPFLQCRRRGGVESTRHLVPSPSCNVGDEAARRPQTVSFPLLPAVSKTRRHEIHMPPCFSSCSVNLVSFLSH